MIVYVSIGNSDDRLTQARWAEFYRETNLLLRQYGHIHGQWVSEPASAWQNACWCLDMRNEADESLGLRNDLAHLAGEFDQDSIAWAEVKDTEFLGGSGG